MDPKKIEMKLSLLQALGAETEERKEAIEGSILKLDGALGAFREAGQKIEALAKEFDRQHHEEEITPEQHKAAIRAIQLSYGVCQSLSDSALMSKTRVHGQVMELGHQLGNFKKKFEAEQERMKVIIAALESGELTEEQLEAGDTRHLHVVNSSAADIQARREAARAEKEAKAKEEEQEAAPKKPRARKGRRKRSTS